MRFAFFEIRLLQAARISGVSPADIGVLLIQLKLLEEKMKEV